MRFDEKTAFPYPVLGIRNDIMPLPDFDFESSESDRNYIFHVNINLNNPSIKYYIDLKKAEYVCEINCRRTFYRTCFNSSTPAFLVIVPKNSVSDEVSISLTVCAKTEILGYENLRANDDFCGYTFDLEPGDVLAYIGSLTIQTDIMADEYKAVGSFLHFIKGKPDSEITYYLGGQDIEITLPRGMYETYSKKLKGNRFRPAILASIVNEALIFAFTNYKGHEQTRWARLLRSAEVLSEFDFDDIDIWTAIEMSRLILKQPHEELFSALADMIEEDS